MSAETQRYEADRSDVAEGLQNPDRDGEAEAVFVDGFFYRAAPHRTEVVFGCLRCVVGRKLDDVAELVRAGCSDDGLCARCRHWGGIPPLPAGHTPEQAIWTRCQFIWDEGNDYGWCVALAALDGERREAPTPALRDVVVRFLEQLIPNGGAVEEAARAAAEEAAQTAADNLAKAAAAKPAASPTEASGTLAPCETCSKGRTDRDILRVTDGDDGPCRSCR
jgi:hypothetical protein